MNTTRDKYYYQKLFHGYSYIVDVKTFSKMLQVSIGTAREILKSGQIFYLQKESNQYMIPKDCVIDYVLSDDYQKLKSKLKQQI